MLTFLHTAAVHAESFERLVKELDAAIPTRHEVREDLLAEAARAGPSETVEAATSAAVEALARDGAKMIVCTCSTIGGLAERAPVPTGVQVMRIDRAMGERAVASGRRIVVAAALPSTFLPTIALLEEIASEQQRAIDVVRLSCEAAWPLFEAGNQKAYAAEIAKTVQAAAQSDDVIVLAQASMAPAAALLAQLGVPILSSPRLGVAAAIARYRASS